MKQSSVYLYYGLFLLFPWILSGQNMIINEVMSSNQTTIADEDGEFPDWIELFNNADSAINLQGYGISDDSLNLQKWLLPGINLSPDKHLLLFASGKDRAGSINHWETVIREGDLWKYQIGNASIPSNWIDLSYDDLTWNEGPSGFGYGDGDDATEISEGVSIYLRKKFEIVDTASVMDIILHVDYDDAFVAYLNGVEVARANIGTSGVPVAYNQFANGDHEALIYSGGLPEEFQIAGAKPYLHNGENVFVIQGFNKETSSDMSLIPFLSLGLNHTPQDAVGPESILGLRPNLYHTNFRVNNDGEFLFLTSPDGQTVDSIWTGNIPTDISYGRMPDGGTGWSLFSNPTPGEVNDSIGFTLQSSMPEFSHTRGFYNETFFLTLTANPVDADIRYTTDGTKPDRTAGILYTGPIEISEITTIRAVAYEDSTSVSDVRTHSFVFPADVLTQDNSGVPEELHDMDHVFWTEEFDMSDVTQTEEEVIDALLDLPTIFISAPWDSIFGIAGIHRGQNLENEGGQSGDPNDPNWIELVECSAEMIYPSNYKGGQFKNWQENCGIKIQGGASRWQNGNMDHKQSFTLEFQTKYGAGKLKNNILATAQYNRESVPAEFDKIILRTGYNRDFGSDWDRANYAYTRDQFARDLQIMMSGWGNHGTYVHLYINGKYWGITNPCERMDDNALATYFGGNNEDYFYGKGKGGILFGSAARYNYLNNVDWTNRQFSDIEEYLVVDPYIDNVILHSYGNIGDGAQYYFGGRTNPPGPIYYTAWDMEDSFDGGARRSGPPVAIENLEYVYSGDNFLAYYRMKNNIDFKMRFADRIYKHCFNNGILTNDRVTAIWDSSCNVISKAMICEIARWGDERGALYDYNHWKNECQDVHNDLIGRADLYITQVKNVGMYPNVDPPLFKNGNRIIATPTYNSPEGSLLTIMSSESASGTIYFTVDGSDPRLWDLTGNISANAIEVNGHEMSIPIINTTVVKARIKEGNIWSPLHELRIIPVKTSDVVVNEINYNSSPGFDTEDWLEIYNNSGSDISLAGWKIKDSNDDHIFEFGQQTMLEKDSFLVVCYDTSAFKALFENVDNYVGNLGFKLGSDGDIVRIFDNNNLLIDIVQYAVNTPWPAAAYGTGATLELLNPDYDNTQPENWEASHSFGSPGKINTRFTVTKINDSSIARGPISFALAQNYPNPFNPLTVIKYSLPVASDVELSVYNIIGQKVETMIFQKQSAGTYQVEWDASGFTSGIYFYHIQAGSFRDSKKMILLK